MREHRTESGPHAFYFKSAAKSEQMTEENFGLVLDSIYDAAAASELWSVALDRLSSFLAAASLLS